MLRTRSLLTTRQGLLLAAGVLLFTLVIYFAAPDILELAELRLLDWRTLLRGPKSADDTVKLILIDSESRVRYGMNEHMRFGLAAVLDDLCEKGAAVIGLDLFFVPGDGNGADRSRRALAQAVEECGNVVIGFNWEFRVPHGRLALPEAMGRRALLDVTNPRDDDDFPLARIPENAVAPDRRITRHAAATGFFTTISDPVHMARKIPAALIHDNRLHYPFGLSIARVYMRDGREAPHVPGLLSEIALRRGLTLRTDKAGYLWFNHYGTQDAFAHMSFESAVSNSVPASFARDSIILVGVSGDESNDLFGNMFQPDLPGVALHATAVSNALFHGFLWRDGLIRALEVALMAAIAVLMGIVVARSWSAVALLIGPMLALIVFLVAQLLLSRLGIWVHIMGPMWIIAALHVVVMGARLHAAEGAAEKLTKPEV
ncbi:CHASE2 domain-containing protein [bacterium]|nr:CHASE2 domain-containing protein [bacterium]